MTSLVKVLWRNRTSINILHTQVYDGDLFEDLVYIIMETGKPKFFAVGEQAGDPGKKHRKKKNIQTVS